MAHYQQAVELDEKMPDAYAGLGVVRMAMYLKDPGNGELRRQAVEHWHRSLELNPNQPKVRKLVDKYQLEVDNPVTVLLNTP